MADQEDVEDEDVDNEEDALSTCAKYIGLFIFWNMTPVLKFHYFLSNQIYSKGSKQCGYIRVLSYVDSKNEGF